MPAILAYLFLVFLLAAVPFGLVVTTLFGGGIDIRSEGSGNIGATNVARVYDWRLATPVVLLDMGKGFFPALGVYIFFPGAHPVLVYLAVVVAFLGHCFSPYLYWKGGKGVATAAGGLLAVIPGPTLLAGLLWTATLWIFGRSSIAALVAVLGAVVATAAFAHDALPLVVLLGVAVALTHVSNIRRIVAGTESRVIERVSWGNDSERTILAEELLEQDPAGHRAGIPKAAPARGGSTSTLDTSVK